ncbi:NYN domain-containing protein [Candidatus Saccharibacteria bacterium]|nr:NYN domain-containing protein [Candidatus Saccharibacteria bacterium]
MKLSSKFSPATPRIKAIYAQQPHGVDQLLKLLDGKTRVYIDYANVRPWSEKLQWHVDPKRLMQFYRSFPAIKEVSLYNGILVGDKRSEQFAVEVPKMGYRFRTKPVKIMRHSIDASSVSRQSTDLIAQFVRRALLRQFDIATVEYLNDKLYELNTKGIYAIEDKKCNFDVEIGTDMLLASERGEVDTFCLWSADSDFADSVEQLLDSGHKVILFATTRRVSRELNELQSKGLFIFDIAKIRNYICWKQELTIHGV